MHDKAKYITYDELSNSKTFPVKYYIITVLPVQRLALLGSDIVSRICVKPWRVQKSSNSEKK